MGRKIPAKKHKGVKDPLEQQAKRLQSLKGKINAPPKDPDEQPIPRSVIDLFAFQNRVKPLRNEKKKQLKLKREEDKLSSSKSNPLRGLRKLPGESGRGFSLRINSAMRALQDPALHTHFPEDTEVDDVKGYRMAAQRERRERKRKKVEKQARLAGGGASVSGGEGGTDRLTKTQKLALKRKAKKAKAADALSERSEVLYEHVQFGEVSHAPPSLPRLHPRLLPLHPATGAPRPGRRDLLLTSMLNKDNNNSSVADRRRLDADKQRCELARLDAVAAYRRLKAERISNKNK